MRVKQSIQNWAALRGHYLEIIYPYELLAGNKHLQDNPDLSGQIIFDLCSKALREANLVVATLDGPQVDDGTAWELGYFYACCGEKGDRILGIRTDFRLAGEREGGRLNAMLESSCGCIVGSLEELLDKLELMVEHGSFSGS